MGDYKELYADTIQREDARKFFRLSNSESMCLFFGTQRLHRNAHELIQVFKEVPNPDVILWIIGFAPEQIRSAVEKASWGDWRIHHYLNYASNIQLEYALKACDYLIMPGKCYLTSAVIALAVSYGVPVVAPRFGCAEDMVKDAGILYDDTQPGGLKDALEFAFDNKSLLQQTARQQMSRWSWQLTAKQTKKAYQLAMESK